MSLVWWLSLPTNVNTNEQTCHGRKSEKDSWANLQEAEGGSESALETGSSSAKSASETALTAGRELTTGDRIYIYISIYNVSRHVVALPTCNNMVIHNFYIVAVNGELFFLPFFLSESPSLNVLATQCVMHNLWQISSLLNQYFSLISLR